MKNFIDLSNDEKLMVLNWRNSGRIRENMHTNKIISKEEHFDFIESLKDDESKKYFLINDIGVIYFNNIKNCRAEIGLYANPTKFGVGSLLMDCIVNFDFDSLCLEVIETNYRAIELYLEYKFHKVDRKKIKDKNIIYMERVDENRKV